jgi:predicted DCC family thiol-disulfide oxidoreductase YuxK
MRVSLGLLVLADLAIRFRYAGLFYGDNGILPSELWYYIWDSDPWVWSVHLLWGGAYWWVALLFVVQALLAVAVLIGYRTRLAVFLTWILLVSLNNANPGILNGGDRLLSFILLTAAFLPLGALFSVDAARVRKVAQSMGVVSVWSAALLLQFALLYFFSSILKNPYVWGTQGAGVYLALSFDSVATRFAPYLLAFPLLVKFLSYFIFYFQHIAPLLLFFPRRTDVVRAVTVALLITLHLSFCVFLHIGLFSWVAISGLMGLIPTLVWDKLGARLTRRFGHVEIFYDGDCRFCRTSAWLIYTFLVLPEAAVRPAQEDPAVLERMRRDDSWVVRTRDGTLHTEFHAMVKLFGASPLWFWLAPVCRMSFASRIGARTYRLVANHRPKVCIIEEPASDKYSRPGTVLSSALGISVLVIILVTNLASVGVFVAPSVADKPRYCSLPISTSVHRAAEFYGRLNQYWGLFTMNFSGRGDGWYVIPGYLADGSQIDLFRGGAPLTFEKPANPAALYPTERWRKYFEFMSRARHGPLRERYAAVLCRDWNKAHPDPSSQLLKLEEIYMSDPVPPMGSIRSEAKPIHIFTYECVT